jgi:hypothetical protein
MQVEASGCGYLDDGRLAILFERHWFYKLLERYTSKELALKTSGEYPQICNPTAGGYEGGVNEWVRYTQAVRINARAAREATSWGLFQVMGFNHGLCGFSNADAMVGSFSISEKEQLKALGNFLLHERNAGLLKAAREENCEEFARLYNGPAYKSHGYDTRLASALRKQG